MFIVAHVAVLLYVFFYICVVFVLCVLGDLPLSLNLGGHRLYLDSSGAWQLSSDIVRGYENQIRDLESKVNELQAAASSRSNKEWLELEKQKLDMETKNLQLIAQIDQLNYKNKILMAMATISEVYISSLTIVSLYVFRLWLLCLATINCFALLLVCVVDYLCLSMIVCSVCTCSG